MVPVDLVSAVVLTCVLTARETAMAACSVPGEYPDDLPVSEIQVTYTLNRGAECIHICVYLTHIM